jgi:hypothetical protein
VSPRRTANEQAAGLEPASVVEGRSKRKRLQYFRFRFANRLGEHVIPARAGFGVAEAR